MYTTFLRITDHKKREVSVTTFFIGAVYTGLHVLYRKGSYHYCLRCTYRNLVHHLIAVPYYNAFRIVGLK